MRDSIWIICFQSFLLIGFTVSVVVVKLKEQSSMSFVDVWYLENQTVNTDYYNRNDQIDQWQDPHPKRLTVIFNDNLGRLLGGITFNTTSSTKNVLSWMTQERCHSSTPFSAVRLNAGSVSISNNTLYLSENGLEDRYFFVTGPHPNGSDDQIILLTKNGSSFSLHDENFQIARTVFWQSNFTYNDFEETNSSIDLKTHSGSWRYINGISVLHESNQSVMYKVGYNPMLFWRCNSSYQINLTDTYEFACDGKINELKDFRAVCIWLYFSENVSNVTVSLTESDRGFIFVSTMLVSLRYPAVEEPTTLSPVDTTEACPCQCTEPQNIYANKTSEELQILLKEITDKIKKELAVDVRSLSSTIRKKTSASDSRPSAAGVGVLGVVLIVSLITSIVVSDLGRMYTGVKKLYKLCHKRICRIKN